MTTIQQARASLDDAHDTAGTSINLATLVTANPAYYSPATFSSSFFSPILGMPTDILVIVVNDIVLLLEPVE